MGDATPPPPAQLGHNTFLDHDDGPTTDTVDDNRSTTSDGVGTDDDDNYATDDDGNYSLLTIDDDDDDDDNNKDSFWEDDVAEIEGLKADQQMPPELVSAINTSTKAKYSIAHQFYNNNKIVFISLDLETGGENCGICQLSAVFKDKDGKDICKPFDSYVKPPDNADWNPKTKDVHGLHKLDPRIINADPIEMVWPKFVLAAEAAIGNNGNQGMIVAWNGKSCDMEWIYRITHGSTNPMTSPKNCHLFMDPYAILSNYKGCHLSKHKTNLHNLQLPTVYKFVSGVELTNAHNSLEDCKAQCTILFDKRFHDYWDKPKSVCLIDTIWGQKTKNRAKAAAEPSRAVHEKWKADNNAGTWKIPREKNYESYEGSGPAGPTNLATSTCRESPNNTFANIFVSILTLDFLEKTVIQTDKYAYKDWVSPVFRNSNATTSDSPNNETGSTPKRSVDCYKPCNETDYGATHRASHCKRWTITLGFLLAWLGIVIVHSAEKNDHSISRHWRKTPYGLRTPWIINTMTRDAFLFLERYLHFADNNQFEVTGLGNPRRPPLFKIQPLLDVLSKNLKLWWTAGQKICIDESMILYKGRAVAFVQYMPAKPIKHGIKVFALCCAATGFLLSFEVYTGAENASYTTNWDLINGLILSAGLTRAFGRILYTGEFQNGEHGTLCYSQWNQPLFYFCYFCCRQLLYKLDRRAKPI